MRRLLADVEARTVLEIGVGRGSFGVYLARRFEYLGIDLDERSLSAARRAFERHGLDPERLLHGGQERVGPRTFDLVCAFEVLEHLEDDTRALHDWRDAVAPGGALLISVPAGPHRFATADQKAGHFRRYSRETLSHALERSGYAGVRMLNYGVPAGYVLEAARNVLARRQLKHKLGYDERTLSSGRWLQPPPALAAVTRRLAAPLALMQRPYMDLDRGTGLVALAQRA